MSSLSERRDLLIGLHAAHVLGRGVLCRLAEDVDRWRSVRGAEAQIEAIRLGIPVAQLRRALTAARRAVVVADAERQRAEAADCTIVVRGEPRYPKRLLDLPMPPPLLYVRGTIPPGPAVAIVGARKMDAYGAEASRYFASGLARAGLPIVSGFAMGIDRVAHRATLDVQTEGGAGTVAVLGCGIDVDYPRNSGALAAEIAAHGAVITELPMGAGPRPWQFPVRNRIIAALAVGTLVVQAKARSGALNTARHALEINRDVYAVPGRVFDELAMGPNGLIADGALAARSVRDVLESLPLSQQGLLFPASTGKPTAVDPADDAMPATSTTPPGPSVKGFPGRILRALWTGEAPTAEALADETGQSVDRVLGALLELELLGHIKRLPGPRYQPANR